MTDDIDPGAYIGHEPELEEETIPGGVGPGDERVSAYDSKPGGALENLLSSSQQVLRQVKRPSKFAMQI